MKSYLGLIPISAKMREKQNRMTILCIILSVFLVTTIFSTADALIQAKKQDLRESHGNWQYAIHDLSEETVQAIRQRDEVDNAGWRASYNVDAEQDWTIKETKTALYGTDPSYLTNLTESVEEGTAPESDTEVMLSSNAREVLSVQIGDTVTLHTPACNQEYTITGFGTDEKKMYQGETYLIAVYMTRNAFHQILDANGIAADESAVYIRFQQDVKAKKEIKEIEAACQISEEQVTENTAVTAFSGDSSRKSVQTLYSVAGVLFILVLLAGSMMISGSLNSSVAQRTQFFGMMRCIGASKKQIRHFVQMEALNWCKTAIPAGVFLGTASRWGICAMLHYTVGGEFANILVWGISLPGILSGTAVGLITVLLASRTPAKRASRVSPVAAVSGNTEEKEVRYHGIHSKGRIEYVLGIHHATASKKNWMLMTASFSLSMVLLFSFSVGLDFFQALIPDMNSWTPDVSLNGYANELNLSADQKTYIRGLEGVKQAYGTGYLGHIPAVCEEEKTDHVNLISYSDDLLDCASGVLAGGTMDGVKEGVSEHLGRALTVSGKDNSLKIGDHVQINGKEVEIVGLLSSGIWESEESVICSEKTFTELTGKSGYSNLMIQLDKNVSDETIKKIQATAGSDVIYSDLRESNRQDRTTYQAFQFVVYGFLAMIALITLCHMMNSISMSVISHTRQYGAMRAVGMDQRQIRRMIGAESYTYVVSGLVVGCTAGIFLNRMIYEKLITHYFGTIWRFPGAMLLAVVIFSVAAGLLAVRGPAKRITEMPVTRTIQEL